MKLQQNIIDCILNAEGKAIATNIGDNINLVPVSTIKVENDKILLVNYFMGKTLENLKENPTLSFACWRGLEGFQIKASVEYKTDGKIFDDIKTWVTEILPDRTVRGVLILTPNEIFDVSATIPLPGIKVE